ncbi:MAG: phytanoyl-CoA dioxygenase family protein [Alphaproteobacteria bacterium]
MTQDQTTLEHFRTHGWMRIEQAFSVSEAAAMRDAAWRALANIGFHRDRPSTWKTERPAHLQHLKADPVFRAVGSKRVLAAIDAALEGQGWEMPKNWGAPFLAFPSEHAWEVPASGWHIDANYLSALAPPAGVRTHALFGNLEPRGGATQIVSGSHRLVHQWFKENPPPPGTRGAEYRQLLRGHPYLRNLHTEGDTEERVARFMDRAEEHDGIPLQVVENTGQAGDVILLHPLTLHVATANNGEEPRFLLSGGVDLPAMWAKETSPLSP